MSDLIAFLIVYNTFLLSLSYSRGKTDSVNYVFDGKFKFVVDKFILLLLYNFALCDRESFSYVSRASKEAILAATS